MKREKEVSTLTTQVEALKSQIGGKSCKQRCNIYSTNSKCFPLFFFFFPGSSRGQSSYGGKEGRSAGAGQGAHGDGA